MGSAVLGRGVNLTGPRDLFQTAREWETRDRRGGARRGGSNASNEANEAGRARTSSAADEHLDGPFGPRLDSSRPAGPSRR